MDSGYRLRNKKDLARIKRLDPEAGEVAEKYYNSFRMQVQRGFNKAVKIVFTAWAINWCVIFGLGQRNMHHIEDARIYDEKSYRKLFEVEKERAGIESDLELKITTKGGIAAAVFPKDPNKEDYIRIRKDKMNKIIMRHELYHVKSLKDKNKSLWTLPPLYWIDEWNATSYAISDLNYKE